MKNITISSILFALVFMLAACGGETETTTDEAQDEMQEEAMAADDGVRTIEIVGTDDMKYKVAEAQDGLVTGDASGEMMLLEGIEVSPGEEIRITLRTESSLPASAMSHNMVLLSMDADVDAFARASIQASDNNYIAAEYEEWVLASTDMLGGGETDTITITAPEETGEYDYICSFPGHYSGGMQGKLIVSE